MVVHAGIRVELLFVRHGMRGHGNDGQRLESGQAAQCAGRRVPIHDGHLDVHQNEIEGIGARLAQDIERFLTVFCHGWSDADLDEQGLDDFAVERLVIHGQDARTLIARRQRYVSGRPGTRQIGLPAHTEPDAGRKSGATAFDAGDADVAVHQFSQAPADGQPQACTAKLAANAGIGLGEGFEQPTKVVGAHADTGILDGDIQADANFLAGMKADQNFHPTGRRELDGVADQIQDDLLDPHRIPGQYVRHCDIDGLDEFQPFFHSAERHHRMAALQQRGQAETDGLEFQMAGGDFGKVEQVVDDAVEVPA